MKKFFKKLWNDFKEIQNIRTYGCPSPIILDASEWTKIYLNDYGWVYIKNKKK